MIEIRDIEAAAARLAGISVRTPLIQNHALDEAVGGKVLIKPECLQVTGSFKIRGAYNFLSQLSPGEAEKGVVAFSSGNHAQGVAAAGSMLGIRTAIVMPEDAPRAKLENTRRLGGEVITYDRYTGDREAIARQIAAERGAVDDALHPQNTLDERIILVARHVPQAAKPQQEVQDELHEKLLRPVNLAYLPAMKDILQTLPQIQCAK